MGIFDSCLLASDIDGTLVENGFISPKSIEKISFFIKEGGMLSLSTGRSVGAVSSVTGAIDKISPSVVANGCMIYDFENKRMVYESVLPLSDRPLLKDILNTYTSVGLEIHCGPEAYTVKRTERTTLHQAYEGFEAPDTDFDSLSNRSWHKALFVFDSADERDSAYIFVADKSRDSDFIKTTAVINGEIQHYLEMVPHGVSKASALKRLCEIYGIKKGGFFAAGDYYNDLEMLKNADISAVPYTSPEDIKQYAEYITCSCADGAVADFIDYLTKKFGG